MAAALVDFSVETEPDYQQAQMSDYLLLSIIAQ